METNTESPSAGAKPRWGSENLSQPKWVLDAVAFNLAMQISADNQADAQARISEEIATVRRMYASPRVASPAQLRARQRNREA